MRHIFLQFTYGVEIGARLAYLGHYRATKNKHILKIANEELEHQKMIVNILARYDKKPTILFSCPFFMVGKTIQLLCMVSPQFLLNFVAQMLEIFAIISYDKLADMYPTFKHSFHEMARTEERHKKYFKKLRIK